MKKFFMIAVMAVAALSVNAQNQEAGTFSLMPHLGLGYSFLTNVAEVKYSDNTTEKFDGFIAYKGGVEAKYQISELFGLSLGLDYQYNKSSKIVEVGSVKNDPSYSFLNIPVLAQFNFGKHFGAKAGIQPGFLLSAKDDGVDFKDECKSTTFSIPVGISWTFNTPLVLDLRYDIPVTRINEKDYANGNSCFNTISLTLGYRFDL